ncbi:MAG: hypothetical protein JWN03_4298 [Nocardia sp.]|uniref:hypothetical protein n=1 Tax=Nocardia sp. TaxID=1821 RepID=UPI0026036907|nr:hypothetical protein [Nocardia sp.]MCU1644023.1 hypothetical protein [Nocardia sp.]
MTDPEYLPDKASIPQWKNDLLRRVHDLAADFVRIESLGADGYDGTDSDPEADWLNHLDALTAVRESTERIALSVGVPQSWIERARDVGAGRTAPAGKVMVPEEPSEAKQFYLDMLSVDLWNLQRMAFVAAARDLRLTDIGYQFGRDPIAGREYQRNMDLLHTRISTLADAAAITVHDAENLWGTGQTEDVRRLAAATVNGWDDLAVEFAWRHYSKPNPDGALPPYIPVDARTGEPVHRIGIRPPTPQQLLDQATDTLRADMAEPSTNGHGDIQTAIDAALPADATWSWAYELSESGPMATEPPHSSGPEP